MQDGGTDQVEPSAKDPEDEAALDAELMNISGNISTAFDDLDVGQADTSMNQSLTTLLPVQMSPLYREIKPESEPEPEQEPVLAAAPAPPPSPPPASAAADSPATRK